ncbi:SOS response-associated peptidase family protein [Rhodobacter capsulatus]|jgi:putative SOS response-associated peptidase YedK|uniref:Abasic site processing protein n=2 Tax=Rhodobacter capsulatus TaxID=1061 RepID=D5ASH1_RHOCB|nr:protein of unknown function DUF159 [Rhodobacter capsulatus SB 1003]
MVRGRQPEAWKAATFNARIEDAREKPAFRQVWRHGRCLVPVGDFYEWSGPKAASRISSPPPETRRTCIWRDWRAAGAIF